VSPQRRTTLLSLAPALPLLSRAAQISLPCPTLLPADLLPPLLSPRRRAPSPPLPGGARRGEAGRRRGALAVALDEVRRGRAAARRARRGPRGGVCGGSRAPGMSLPLSPTLSLLSVLPHLSLIGKVLRGAGTGTRRRIQAAASTPCNVDPHDSGSRVDAWIQAGRVDSLLPRRGSTRRRHGSMARRPQPAALAQIRRGGDPGGGSSEVRWLQYWAGTGSSMGSRMGSPVSSWFFCFFKRLTAAGTLHRPPR